MQTPKNPVGSLIGLAADSDKRLGTQTKGQKDFIKDDEHGSAFPDNADEAYIVLLNVFAYLSTKDLISAARVSKIWNLVSSDHIFWRRVSLNKVSVNNSDMMIQRLKEHGVKSLDTRGARFFSLSDRFDWRRFYRTLAKVTTLDELILELASLRAVALLGKVAPQLKSLSVFCRCNDIEDSPLYGKTVNINFLKNMKELETFKLVSREPIKLNIRSGTPDDIQLKLTKLIITEAMNLYRIENILPTTLVSLGLGDCTSLKKDFWRIGIHKLVNLRRLRLERCLHFDLTLMIVAEISKLPNLSEFEFIDFAFPSGFQSVMSKCKQLEFLLLNPRYDGLHDMDDTIINYEMIQCLYNMKNSLKVFVWAVSFKTWVLPSLELDHLQQVEMGLIIPFAAPDKILYVSSADIQSRLKSYLKVEIVETTLNPILEVSLKNFM